MSTDFIMRTTGTKPNVIAVVDWAYSERDHHRFGVKYFVECGFNVTIFNFCEITFPHVKLADSFDATSVVSYLRIRSRNQFKFRIKSIESPTTVLIMAGAGSNPRIAWYFRQMKKAGFRMGLVSATVHPILDSNVFPTSFRMKVIKALYDPRKAVKYLISKIVQITTYFPAVDFFCAAGEFAEQMAHPLLGPNTKLIPIQSFDFDRMWEVGGKSLSGLPERFAVFLDEYLPFHPDYDALKIAAPLSAEQYYPNLRRIFDRIEEAYSCKVVIAAHPRAVYSEKQVEEWFGGRQVVFSETPALVSDSILALAHASTSISYVILKNKPLLLIDSDRWIGSFMRAGIDSICAILCPRLVFLEGEEAVPVHLDSMILDPERLSRYRSDFIGSPAAKKCPSYWVLAAIVRGEL